MKTVPILGVNVSCARRQDILQWPLAWAEQPGARTVFYVNAHCLNLACANPHYRAALNAADLVYPDGISVVWAARWLTGCRLEKVTGRDWIHDFCALSASKGLRLYLLAGKPGVAETARQRLMAQTPGLEIAGARHGYFHESETPAILSKIRAASPHVLLVGLSTPRQELWLAANRSQIEAPVCWAVGALFDYVAGIEPPVPAWLNRLNLEWLWRMLVDPAGKWRRYLFGNPLFIARILAQKWGGATSAPANSRYPQ